jgi:hypothetical protein
MEYHSIERTSPKGQEFFGTCIRCGKKNLPAKAIYEECPNTKGMTSDEALVELVKGD